MLAAFFLPRWGVLRYFLYLDESGDPKNRTDKVFVLAGVALFERQTHWATRDLDAVVSTNFITHPRPEELHAEEIRSARGFWRRVAPDLRRQVMADTYNAIATNHHLTAFGAVVDLDSYSDPPLELAFEQLCIRFDAFLRRIRRQGVRQNGILIMDESRYEPDLQALLTQFRTSGTSVGAVHTFSEVPLFTDSASTRLLQIADFIAYALFRAFARGDETYLNQIRHRFDETQGTVHGLVHLVRRYDACPCFACQSRRHESSP